MADPSPIKAPKVAIPRLPPREIEKPPPKKKEQRPRGTRVGRACINCRQRKVKCSGDLPQCVNCATSELECAYEQARRDRLKSVTRKNQDLAQLLRELSLRVDSADQALIRNALESYEEDAASVTSINSLKRKKREIQEDEDRESLSRLEAYARDTIAPGTRLGYVDDDQLRSREARELGYIGQGAEMYWLHSLQDHGTMEEPNVLGTVPSITPATESHRLTGTSDASFYLDSERVELDIEVDSYGMPTVELAEQLLGCYMKTVHKSFPILPPQFVDQLQRYFRSLHSGHPLTVSNPWLAIVNIVFAIGARYSHLVRAIWHGEERDHLVYMKRALVLLGPWPFNAAPDLAMVHVVGLLSFYYLAIGHVNRAWIMIGVSVRLALTLGLHLRNEDSKTPSTRKEMLSRTWWSLHAIECLLSAITGRTCMLSREDCTVPLPSNSSSNDIDSAGSSSWACCLGGEGSSWLANGNMHEENCHLRLPRSYENAHLTIGPINQKVMSTLYSLQALEQSWDHVKIAVPALLRELDEWKRASLPNMNELSGQTYLSAEDERGKALLRFHYFSTMILITRPCLCRVGRKRQGSIPWSTDFDQNVAEECVEAALELTCLLPDEPNATKLYEEGPWWSIAHHIMQAMAVLLLEFSHCEQSVRDEPTRVQGSINKLLCWIRATRNRDPVMVQAHKVVVNILKQESFRNIAQYLLIEEDLVIEESQHTAPDPVHSQPSSDYAHPTNASNSQHFHNCPSEDHIFNMNMNRTEQFPQSSLYFSQQPTQREPVAQLNQVQSQTEIFPFISDLFADQSMFIDPFMTELEQIQPLDVGPEGSSWSDTQNQGDCFPDQM